jgi:hypothetical protein
MSADGQIIAFRVSLLQAAPTNGLRVTRSTNNRAIAVPTAQNIPAGARSFEFLVQLNTVTAPTDVKVFASFGGYTAGTTVRVNP